MEKSIPVAIAAVVISVIAITSTLTLKPVAEIGAGAVGTSELADDSVTGDKIVDGTITDSDIATAGISKIANNAVGSDQIADNSITFQDLSSSVTDAIAGISVADNSITSAKIQDGTITNVDISPTAAIDLSKLATHPFGLTDLAANSVDSTKIVDGSVTSADIQDGTIQTTDIAAGALTQTAENFGTTTDTTTEVWSFTENLDDARVEITTGNNPVLITFSGVFSDNTAGGRVRIGLVIDGSIYAHATRTGTSAAAGDPFVLAFNCIPTLSAGPHVIQVKWCVMASGEEGSAYNRVLDVIELKR